jgi:hypothetical protein
MWIYCTFFIVCLAINHYGKLYGSNLIVDSICLLEVMSGCNVFGWRFNVKSYRSIQRVAPRVWMNAIVIGQLNGK